MIFQGLSNCMIVRPAIRMAGKKKLDFSDGGSTRPPSDAPSAMESALADSLKDMKVSMAQRILASECPSSSAKGDKKDKKKKKKKKKKRSTSSSDSDVEPDSEEFLQELGLQLSLKAKHLKLKDMIKFEDLAADAWQFFE